MKLTIHNITFAGKSLAKMSMDERRAGMEFLLKRAVLVFPTEHKSPGVKAAVTRKRRAAARKAVATKRSKST